MSIALLPDQAHLFSLQLKQKGLDQPRLVSDRVLAGVHRHRLQRLLDHSLHPAAVQLAVVEELDALCDHRVPDTDHLLGKVFHKGEETPLGVEPSVRPQLFVVRLQGLDDPRNAELIVALGAVQCPYKGRL